MFSTGYLIDTNILSKMGAIKHPELKDDVRVKCVEKKWNEVKDSGQIFICTPVIGEVEYGIRIAPKKDVVAAEMIRQIIRAFPMVLDIDEPVARACYADLKARLFTKFAPKKANGKGKSKYIEDWVDGTTGKSLGVTENDVWIAAVAICHNLTLVTNDGMRHIADVAGDALVIEDWSASSF